MNKIITADWHFTEDFKNDDWKFRIFIWLGNKCNSLMIKHLIILGDLTENKDRHSERLVNKIVEGFQGLLKSTGLERIYILKGNHDYKAKDAFFRFLDSEKIAFISKPMIVPVHNYLFIPHGYEGMIKTPEAIDYVFLHDSYGVCKRENGTTETGKSIIPAPGLQISGHIHKAQDTGKVIYVGSPYYNEYDVNDYKPRILYTTTDNEDLCEFVEEQMFPKRFAITVQDSYELENIIKEKNLHKEDQIKVKILVFKSETVDKKKLENEVLAICSKAGVQAVEVSMKIVQRAKLEQTEGKKKGNSGDILKQYCRANNLSSSFLKIGSGLLGENK